MTIVLIGANGKIGELVQKALADAGHEIVKVGRVQVVFGCIDGGGLLLGLDSIALPIKQ